MFWNNDKKKIAELEAQLACKDEQLKELEMRVMQNQIRPHFIFNMLLCIKELCMEDPKLATKALQYFAHYLRTNLESLSSTECVPFEQELECIRQYVALEKMDPACRFRMDYDIQYADFKLPLFTVQPMVENAIRHGISVRKGNGVVSVSTALEEGNVVIVVADNGSGYISETRQQSENRHVGIVNTKERLRLFCDGELSIVNMGHGTIVRITIPLKNGGDRG